MGGSPMFCMAVNSNASPFNKQERSDPGASEKLLADEEIQTSPFYSLPTTLSLRHLPPRLNQLDFDFFRWQQLPRINPLPRIKRLLHPLKLLHRRAIKLIRHQMQLLH